MLLILSVLLLCPIHIISQDTSPATVFKNVRVFDGEKIIPPCTVVITADKISAVNGDAPVPEGAELIDGNGLTLLPGFFDAHVHIWGVDSLRQSLAFGVTTVVDMYMELKTMNSLKKAQAQGKANDRAYFISPGILVTAPGGHGTQYGLAIPTIKEPREAQDFVAARIAEGSDFIKIIWDDGGTYAMTRPTLDLETVTAVIEAAHQQGKLTIIHADSLQKCIDALDAGVSGLAHLYFNNAFDPEFGRLAAQKKAFVIPTLTVLEGMHGVSQAVTLADNTGMEAFLKPSDLTSLESTFPFNTEKGAYEAAEKAVEQLNVENVPILAGSDAPNPGTTYGASLHRELELLVKAGLSPLEALRSATSIPAQTFGLKDRGLIQEGKLADLVLVQGDPSQDIKDTRNIISVWRAGKKVDRDKYKASVAKEKLRIEKQKKSPQPENSESGWISDFEGEKIAAHFGAGWSVSTDSMTGGKSKAEYRLEPEGAQDSSGSLLITGVVDKDSATPWAGAFFSPGKAMMNPANLSFKKAISFWAKGDGKTYSIMIFAQSLGFMPAMLTFQAGPDWKEFTFPFDDFKLEGYDIMGIFIGGSTEPGAFRLQIDDVRLK